MDPKKRKREPSPDQDSATPASRFFQTIDAGQIQPLDGTGCGSTTYGNRAWVGAIDCMVGASSEFKDGKLTLPPISAIFNKLLLPSVDQIDPLQVTERLDTLQASSAGVPVNPDPVHHTPAPPKLGGGRPVTSFTIPPTEEGTAGPPVCDSC